MPTPEQSNSLERILMSYLDDAIAMQINMSEDEEAYHLTFISQKLAKVSTYMERLSDIMMKVSQKSLIVRRGFADAQSALKVKERRLRDSDDYREAERSDKTRWLESQLADEQSTLDEWRFLSAMVSEVKEAVSDRLSTIKRLDSDLRLHSKILEAKILAGVGGATSPTSFTGSRTEEIDID